MRHAIWTLTMVALAAGTVLAAQIDVQSLERRGYKPLLNAKDTTGWKLRREGGKNGWKVEDGMLVNAPPSTDLVTEEKFKDFQLHVEYKVPARSNSGIYLRGRYEIQIDDAYGKSPERHQNGAIYGRITPSENASKPAGEWQTVDVTLVGKHVTVVLNGKKTIDHVEIPGPTGGALDDKVEEPGPLMLQGDHGVVSFRNIYIRPL